MTYRAELSGRALKQMYGLPGLAFDSFIETLAYDTSLWAATCGWWIPPRAGTTGGGGGQTEYH